MTTPHTWTFDDGPIRSIAAEPGRIVLAKGDEQLTLTRKGDGQWVGFMLMAQQRHKESAALLAAYRIAWPDLVQPPDSIVVGLNIDIDEVTP